MALVVGTNCGLVTVAPTGDPADFSYNSLDGNSMALKITTGSAITITEMGWYTGLATPQAIFDMGIYDHDAGNDNPENIVHQNKVNAKGTSLGWKVVSGLDWSLDASTIYWLVVQLDDTAPDTPIEQGNIAGQRRALQYNTDTLPDPFTGTGLDNKAPGIYAVYELPPPPSHDVNATVEAEIAAGVSITHAAEATVEAEISITFGQKVTAEATVEAKIEAQIAIIHDANALVEAEIEAGLKQKVIAEATVEAEIEGGVAITHDANALAEAEISITLLIVYFYELLDEVSRIQDRLVRNSLLADLEIDEDSKIDVLIRKHSPITDTLEVVSVI